MIKENLYYIIYIQGWFQQYYKILQYFGNAKSQSIAISIAKSQSVAIFIAKNSKYCKKYCNTYKMLQKVLQSVLQNLKSIAKSIVIFRAAVKII